MFKFLQLSHWLNYFLVVAYYGGNTVNVNVNPNGSLLNASMCLLVWCFVNFIECILILQRLTVRLGAVLVARRCLTRQGHRQGHSNTRILCMAVQHSSITLVRSIEEIGGLCNHQGGKEMREFCLFFFCNHERIFLL